MTRAARTLSALLIIVSIYNVCLLGIVPLPSVIQDRIIPVLPLWALVSFGAYLLFKLGYGVLTFNDVPEAHDELMKEIEQAREELKKKGVSVD